MVHHVRLQCLSGFVKKIPSGIIYIGTNHNEIKACGKLPRGQYFDRISISVKGIVTKHNSKSEKRLKINLKIIRDVFRRSWLCNHCVVLFYDFRVPLADVGVDWAISISNDVQKELLPSHTKKNIDSIILHQCNNSRNSDSFVSCLLQAIINIRNRKISLSR